jgi:hypothetical protein
LTSLSFRHLRGARRPEGLRGPHRLLEEEEDGVLTLGDDEAIPTEAELDREAHGAPEPVSSAVAPSGEREQTPGERALANSRPRRIDSQGRAID